NGCTPNSGLGGAPVGIPLPTLPELDPLCPNALLTKGFRPWMGASRPPLVIRPHLTRSRRETLPCEYALTISALFFRAFSASRSRALEAFSDKKKPSSL